MAKYTKQQYEEALKTCEELINLPDDETIKNDPRYAALEEASAIIEEYEKEHWNELNDWHWWDTLKIKIWDPVKSFRYWCRLCINKRHFHVVKEATKGYPFDYAYLYNLEYAKLKEMLRYHETSKVPVCDKERLQVKRSLQFAISMMDIFMDDSNLYESKHIGPLLDKEGKFNARSMRYNCKVKVNTRNGDRFCSKSLYSKFPHELYVEKARYLYHQIRYRYECSWWD